MKSYQALEDELNQAKAKAEILSTSVTNLLGDLRKQDGELAEARQDAKYYREKAERWEKYALGLIEGRIA